MAIDPFFASTRKRKRNNNRSVQKKQPERPKNTQNNQDSDIEGDSDDADHFNTNASSESSVESSDEEIEETAAEKRVRLAKAYLDSIEKNAEGMIFMKEEQRKCICWYKNIEEIDGFDAADLDRDIISERLKKDDVCLFSSTLSVVNM